MKDHFYKQVQDYSPVGLIYQKIIIGENGIPKDFEFLVVNKVVETLMGRSANQIKGLRASQFFSDDQESFFQWYEEFANPSHCDSDKQKTVFLKPFKRWFRIKIVQGEKNYWTIFLTDISDEVVKINQLEAELQYFSKSAEVRQKKEEELRVLSYRDALTGLGNRRHYDKELRKLDRESYYPITLIMADVNGLKLANDGFGHEAGDALLLKFAAVLKAECPDDACIARVGGDEFLILLSKTDGKKAKILIDRLNNLNSKQKVNQLVLSYALGFSVKTHATQNMEDIYREAEERMYRHKATNNSRLRSQSVDLILTSLFEKFQAEKLHAKRVSILCKSLAIELEFTKEAVTQMGLAGLLHDIGKIGINEEILNKTGRIDVFERMEIERHAELGHRILGSVNDYFEIADYVLAHHERWDGKGYPKGLKTTEIPAESRILALAEAYDAMTNERSYDRQLSKPEAICQLQAGAGKQFDPEYAKVFVERVLKSPWKK